MMQIPYVNLTLQHNANKDEILQAVSRLLDSGKFILGEEVERFEQRFADYCGTRHALGVASGTDALLLAMRSLGIGPGDEVITVSHSFLATASSIALAGAKPVFVDAGGDMNINAEKIGEAITGRTKAVIPVHLTGRPADMAAINEIAEKHNLHIIEDAAQAAGAEYQGKKAGGLGAIGCFSFHPLKNLSACGDGGAITTNDKGIYEWLVMARNHGLKNRDECAFWSINSRLDAMQAAILNVKLAHLDGWNERRREIARKYNKAFKEYVTVPDWDERLKPVFHTYVIQTARRDGLQKHLSGKGIETKVHYPIAIHRQEAAKPLGHKPGALPVTERMLNEILSLPVYPELTDEQVEYICLSVCEFF